MHTGQTSREFDQGPAVIRALRSLTYQDAEAIRQAVKAVAPEWRVQEHDDYDGYLSVLISRGDDAGDDQTYVISGTVDKAGLAEFRDDELLHLGWFATIAQAVAKLTAALTAARRPGDRRHPEASSRLSELG